MRIDNNNVKWPVAFISQRGMTVFQSYDSATRWTSLGVKKWNRDHHHGIHKWIADCNGNIYIINSIKQVDVLGPIYRIPSSMLSRAIDWMFSCGNVSVRVGIDVTPDPEGLSVSAFKKLVLEDLDRKRDLYESWTEFRFDILRAKVQAGDSVSIIMCELDKFGLSL